MKKTISVNIKGINFIIEENAYERLDNYLVRLRRSLNNQEGSEEIIEDIEIRIAELCKEKLNGSKEVVELVDIESIIETLGEPEEYVHTDEETTNQSQSHSQNQSQAGKQEESDAKHEKRLYRDTENAQIAGVCQGIANYFNMDVVIIRIIWVLIFLFGGFGMLLYIILWIVVPKTNSTIDRLRMKGKPITVETVREEVENAADTFRKSTRKFASQIRENGPYAKKINFIGRAVSVAFALFSIFIGIISLIAFLAFLVGGFQFIPAKTDSGFLSISQIGELALSSSSDVSTAWIGGSMLAGSVILFLFLFGFYILFKLKNKWTRTSLWLLFLTAIVGGVICIWLGLKTGRDMTITGEIKRSIGVVSTEQLIIESDLPQWANTGNIKVIAGNQDWLMEIKDNRIYNSDIRFKFRESKDSLFHIHEIASAKAHTMTAAVKKAKNIHHPMVLIGDSLKVGTSYDYPKSDKFRLQDFYVIIEIPANKSILFNGKLIQLGKDYDFEEKESENEYTERGRLRGDGRYEHNY